MFASAGISVCNYFFFSALPIYAQKVSGTTAYAGLLTSVYTFAALAVRPLSGILADKIGRTKLLILGAFLCTIACSLYYFDPLLILLLCIRALHGVGFGIQSTSGGAVAADVIPKSRMAEGIGYFGLYGTIAAAVAPGLALSIIGDGEMQSFRTLFILAAAVSFVSMIFACFITYERKDKAGLRQNPQAKANINNDKPADQLRTLFYPALVLVLAYIALSSVTSFLPLFALDRNLGNIGLFYTVNAVGLFLSRLFLGKIADKKGVDVVVIPGIILLAFCFLLIPLVHHLTYLLIIAFPLGFAQGAVGPAINTLMFNLCSANRRGMASAAFFSSIDTGFGLGSLMFGFIAESSGYYFVYWGAMIITALSLIAYLSGIVKRGMGRPVNSVS